jgi:cytochrome P450
MALVSAIVIIVVSLFLIAVIPVLRHRTILYFASRRRNCVNPPLRPSRDPIFGIDILIKNLTDLKNNRLVKERYAAFRKYGKTYGFYLFGRRTIHTIDPRNLQFVLSSEDEKFGVGSIREKAGLPLIGRGVLTTDGEVWKKHRSEVMPVFAKAQIADREMFEKYFLRFLQKVKEHDGTVDLKPLFEELVRIPDEIIVTPITNLMA